MTKIDRTQRNTSVELLRCLLAFLIVLYHAAVLGRWSACEAFWMIPFVAFLVWHVDCFVAISGWFGIKFSWKKFFRLWGVMAFYTLLSAGVGHWLFGEPIGFKSCVVNGGWFGGAYLALMLISPCINAAVMKLSEEGWTGKCAWLLFAVALTLNWAPFNLFSGLSLALSQQGGRQHSLLVMSFVYFTVRMIAATFKKPLPIRRLLMGPAFFIGTILAIGISKSLVDAHFGRGWGASQFRWLSYYDAPHVWVMAVSMMLIFVWCVKVPTWLGKVCGLVGPSMFGVYLAHTNDHCFSILPQMQQHIVGLLQCHPAIAIFLSALLVFGAALVVDLLRRFACRVAIKAYGLLCHQI